MQWLAVYDQGNGGLYFGTHDARAHSKDFLTRLDNGGLELGLVHYPENMGKKGIGYRSPYPVILQYTPGHWYDAAQIYREWALKQIWVRKGTVAMRSDIPQWYKDAPVCFVTYSYSVFAATCNDFADYAIRYKEFFEYDGPIPMVWYEWPVFRPDETSINKNGAAVETGGTHAGHPFPAKEGFAEAVTKLGAHGIYVQPYVNARVYDVPSGFPPDVPSELLAYTKKDVNGRPRGWSHTDRWKGLVDLCRTTSFHQQLVTSNCVRLATDFGAKGAYLDQFGQRSHACFDPEHGHPLGGGDYQFLGIREMANKVRQVCRRIDGDAVFSGENGSDAFIDVLDSMLIHYELYPGLVPVRQAVYAEYWPVYGRHMRTQNVGDDVEFRMSVGNQFVYGIKIGRVNVQSSALLDEPRYSENMQLLKRLVKYRAAAKNYLQYGRMLRPLVLEGAMPLVKFRMKESTLARHDAVARQTAVMSSVWEGVDGSLAVVLFNISGMEQVFKARLSANMYPILNECSELYSLMADGSELLCGRLESGALILEGKLGRDEVRILVAR